MYHTDTAKPKRRQTLLRSDLLDHLADLKREKGYRSYSDLIIHLVSVEENKDSFPLLEVDRILTTTIPIILSGPSGSGKTTTAKQILKDPRIKNALILDSSSEYGDISQKIWDYGAISSFRFTGDVAEKGMHRITLDSDVELSKTQASLIFRILLTRRTEMKDWTLVIEDAHRFESDQLFKTLVSESRKYFRLIAVGCGLDHLQDLAQVYRPPKI